MRCRRSEAARQLIPGLFAVAIAAAPVAWIMIQFPGVAASPRVVGWWICVLGFCAALTLSVRPKVGHWAVVGLQLAQSALALVANWLIPMAIEGVALTGILLVVAAVGLASLPRRVAVVWLAAQTALLLGIYLERWPAPIALAAGAAYGVMQVVLYSMAVLARSERERRVALEGAMRDLQATRAVLEATVRSDERAEIARDLHDVMGHHLVALGLQLDAALQGDAAPQSIVDARRLVRLLLSDVREVVADLRSNPGVDLRGALMLLATDGPGPRVIVEVAPDAMLMPSGVAQALLRCAQEALTNARKHAQASVVTIRLDANRLRISDDGRGLVPMGRGTGIDSMRERSESCGCRFSVSNSPGRGGGAEVLVEWGEGARS